MQGNKNLGESAELEQVFYSQQFLPDLEELISNGYPLEDTVVDQEKRNADKPASDSGGIGAMGTESESVAKSAAVGEKERGKGKPYKYGLKL